MTLPMNGAHLHLLLNHFPVITPMLAIPITAIGVWRQSPAVQKVGLWLLTLTIAMGAAAYFSGSPAAEILKDYPGINHSALDNHALAAPYVFLGNGLVGLASLLLLRKLRKAEAPSPFAWASYFVLTLWALTIVLQTARLGGQIKHEETQEVAASGGGSEPSIPTPKP